MEQAIITSYYSLSNLSTWEGKREKKFLIKNKVKEGRSFGNALKQKEGRSLGNGGSITLYSLRFFLMVTLALFTHVNAQLWRHISLVLYL